VTEPHLEPSDKKLFIFDPFQGLMVLTVFKGMLTSEERRANRDERFRDLMNEHRIAMEHLRRKHSV